MRVLLLLTFTLVGCRFPVTFVCEDGPGAACPARQTCPAVPLGAGGCEALPGLFGEPAVSVDVGRPVGCSVGLPYGNPHYSGIQQHCTCTQLDPGATPQWQCPI